MKPNKKREPPENREHERTVDDENLESKTNEQEEEGGGYARPRAKGGSAESPWLDRPCRGD